MFVIYFKNIRRLFLLFAACPPVQIVLISLAFFLVSVVVPGIQFVQRLGQLCLRKRQAATLAAVLSQLRVPFQGSPALRTIGYFSSPLFLFLGFHQDLIPYSASRLIKITIDEVKPLI